ncbi:uncharacterized protein LOC129888657 [Solanum dulcamara]|uniref:uncharacterized protein LOC129888657 n=1 Tax=Solanum dulcamara TaxID=45834 RepID=UPI0024861F9F|nr:uncharacterized protein LOC129888657 [Solanum dulcamara]
MAAKTLTTETIALTEKKMDMTLDDIIKMSKTNTTKTKQPRVSNRSQKFSNNIAQDKSAKIQRFMDTRSSMRQGALAQRRSIFQGDQFPLATEAARRVAVAPIRNRAFNRGRAMNINKQRFGTPPVQKSAANGARFIAKQLKQEVKAVSKQRPQTLDSLFANMKEQRMKMQSQQNNAPRRNGGGQHVAPWARGHFGK